MTCSASCSNRLLAALLLALVLLSGCSGAGLRPVQTPMFSEGQLLAVLPVENLSGAGGVAPGRLVRQELVALLEGAGFPLVDERLLEQFLLRHRVRWMGGVDSELAKAFKAELGVSGVLVTNLTRYHDTYPLQVGLFCRLVSTGAAPEVVWMDGVGMAGDDAPGLLDLGLIDSQDRLLSNALDLLVDSLSQRLAGEGGRSLAWDAPKELAPKITFNSSALKTGRRYSIGVVPFSNESATAYAGEIMALHFVQALSALEGFNVMEPGVVRERLLDLRIIMEEGISLKDLYLMSSNMGTELFLTGKVERYEDPVVPLGSASVDFSVLLMEGSSKRNVWASKSYNHGREGVFFFERGRVGSAFRLASSMTRALFSGVDRSAEVTSTTPEGAWVGNIFRMFWERGHHVPSTPEQEPPDAQVQPDEGAQPARATPPSEGGVPSQAEPAKESSPVTPPPAAAPVLPATPPVLPAAPAERPR